MAVRPFKCKMMDLLLKLDKERNYVLSIHYPSIINHGLIKGLYWPFLLGEDEQKVSLHLSLFHDLRYEKVFSSINNVRKKVI